MTADSKVIVVVDPEYGERLLALPAGVPVWIVDTPANRAAAHQRWRDDPQPSHLSGVTTFDPTADDNAEEALLNEIDVIDEHHGWYSSSNSYTILEVIGARLTQRVKDELSRYQFDRFTETDTGFLAARRVATT